MRRKTEGRSRRGRAGAGAAEGGASGVRTGGPEQTGKGGKGQLGTSGTRQAARHQEGKGGKGGGQGQQWPQPQHSFKQPPPGSPPQVSAAVRSEEEREAGRQQTARYKALAHMERQRHRRQAPKLGPETIYRQEMASGKGRSERQCGQEGIGGGHGSQPSGRPQRGEGQAGHSRKAAAWRDGQRVGGQEIRREQSGQAGAVQGRGAGREESCKNRHGGPRCARDRTGARRAPGKGIREGRTPGSRQQGAREGRASRKMAGESWWRWVHRVTGIPREGMGSLGRCLPACHPALSATTLPCGREGVPTPTSVPGCAIARVCAAAPAGREGGVGSTGGKGRGAQEGMGEDRGGRKEAAREESTDHARSVQDGGGMDGGAGHAAGRGGAGS